MVLIISSFCIFMNFFFWSCSDNAIDYKNYMPERYPIDTTIESKDISNIERVVLEENDSIFIVGVSDSKIHPNHKLIGICDNVNKCFFLYDYKSGKFINQLKSGIYLTDSIINSPHGAYPHDGGPSYYLDLKDYKDNLNEQEMLVTNNNNFLSFNFAGKDEINIIGLGYAVANTSDNRLVAENRTMLIKCDLDLNINDIIAFENNQKAYSLPYTFGKTSNNNYLLSIEQPSIIDNKPVQIDNHPVLALYDSQGNFIKYKVFKTDFYESLSKKNRFRAKPIVLTLKDQIFITYPFDLSIYDDDNDKNFDLRNLPYKYSQKTVDIYDNSQEYAWKNKTNLTKDDYDRIFPVKVLDVLNINGNIGILISVHNKDLENGNEYILQEYSLKGELLSQTNFFDDETSKIYGTIFDEKNQNLVFVRKEKKNWVLEKRSWK